MTPTRPPSAPSEQRALRASMLMGVALAVLGITWGVLGGSQMILFDGAYALVGISLSALALGASKVVESGPTTRYPYGREALTPMVIAVQGIALFATCAYATCDAVLTILDGGGDVTAGSAIAYAGLSLIGAAGAYAWMRRNAHGSDLVVAEATQWLAGASLSVGMLVGFGAVLVLEGTSWSHAARYVDPAMVIVACAVLAPAPFRMVRSTVVELLEGAPPRDIQAPVLQVIDELRADFGLDEHHLRMTKAGRKLYVEVDFIVSPEYEVRQADAVRRSLVERLDDIPQATWLNVEFTSDPTWGE
jgi:cation diffusion facilitator family transporter